MPNALTSDQFRERLMTAISEAALQDAFIGYLQAHRWTVFHDADSRRSDAGIWDLLCLRERLVFVESKTERGHLTKTELRKGKGRWYERFGQVEFGELLTTAGVEHYVLRPSTRDALEEAMK